MNHSASSFALPPSSSYAYETDYTHSLPQQATASSLGYDAAYHSGPWNDAASSEALYTQPMTELQTQMSGTYFSSGPSYGLNDAIHSHSTDMNRLPTHPSVMRGTSSVYLSQAVYQDGSITNTSHTHGTLDPQHGNCARYDARTEYSTRRSSTHIQPMHVGSDSSMYVAPDAVNAFAYSASLNDHFLGYPPSQETSSSHGMSPYSSYRAEPSSSYPSLSSNPPDSPRSSATLKSCKPRNVQVSPPTSNASVPSASSAPSADRWRCPHCEHVQHNHRAPDLKRHIATHLRSTDSTMWICCGVPVVEAIKAGIPEDVLREGGTFTFGGMTMVGGCLKTFSRRDAYGRHLKREKGICWGDPQALYQPGNRP